MPAERDELRKVSRPWHGALLLAGFAFVCTGVVAVTHSLTAQRIENNQHAMLLERFTPVLRSVPYDNIDIDDPRRLSAPGVLPGDGQAQVFTVKNNGAVTAIALAVATIGYAGPIELLVGIDIDGSITGVRVISHKETPGLGDRIDASRSDWINQFNGRSLTDPATDRWRIRADGGDFEEFTGASVTPRAVVAAIKSCLLYFRAHSATLISVDKADKPESL